MDRPKLGFIVEEVASLTIKQDSPVEEVIDAMDENRPVTRQTSTTSESSVQKYEDEWKWLREQDEQLVELRQRALQGDLRASRVRSICWRVLLGVLSAGKPESWVEDTRKSRKSYYQLSNRLQVNPRKDQELLDDNPLSQKSDSPWNQYFCDQELQNVITQDVIRTFPGVDFFRDERIQNIMVNVLFCYARDHPEMCYRQGMHEILAPMLFVIHSDHQAFLHAKELNLICDVVNELMDPNYVEEDCYAIFVKVMFAIQGSYHIENMAPSNTGYFPIEACWHQCLVNLPPFRYTWCGYKVTELALYGTCCACLKNTYHIVVFPDSSTPRPSRLNNFSLLSRIVAFGPVNENQVLQQLNWIRDNILAPSEPEILKHLETLDIPLPLFGIRWLRLLFGREFPLQDLLVLWDAIFAECSMCDLVNYLVVSMLSAIREQLLSSDYTTSLSMLMRYPTSVDVSQIIENAIYLKYPKIAHRPESHSGPSRHDGKPVNYKPEKKKKVISNLYSDSNNRRMKKLSVKNKSQAEARYIETSSIIDGFILDDPSTIRNDLKHCHAVMSLVQLKLAQYHHVLEQCVPPGNMKAQQALTGIHELCSLLDPHRASRSPSLSVEVESACEAGESSPSTSSSLPPPRSDVIMTTFKESQGHPIESTDLLLPYVKR